LTARVWVQKIIVLSALIVVLVATLEERTVVLITEDGDAGPAPAPLLVFDVDDDAKQAEKQYLEGALYQAKLNALARKAGREPTARCSKVFRNQQDLHLLYFFLRKERLLGYLGKEEQSQLSPSLYMFVSGLFPVEPGFFAKKA
jgi:hypothetical protein